MMAQSNVENLSPHVIRQVYKELYDLTQNPLEGIEVLFNEQDITSVQADIDGPAETPYFGGSFRIRIQLGKCYPTVPPKGFFVTKIFHPNVGRNGEICVNTLKKDWKQDLGIKHILLTIKCLLIAPNPESALNEEASKMLLERYEDYSRRAKMLTEIHAPRSKTNQCAVNDCPSSSSSVNMNNSSNNNSSASSTTTNNISNSNTLSDKIAPPSAGSVGKHPGACDGTGSQKQPIDGLFCSDEPASKRLNTLIDCYNSINDALDTPNSQLQHQQQQSSSIKANSSTSATSHETTSTKQPSKPKITGSNLSNKNRGLKRVLRLRS